MRDVVAPTTDERGHEQHPSWVMIGASRVSSSHGAVLFDSDVRHQHYVVVKLMRADRKRDLSHDWVSASSRLPIVEVALSEAQWASFVSSMNTGDGIPATMIWHEDDGHVPGMPYAPRLQVSMDEVRGAAEKAQAEVAEAFAAYEEKKSAENLRTLKYAIANMPANVEHAATSLSEHAENVVQRARADIEAVVVQRAKQLGIDPAEVGEFGLAGDERKELTS